MTNAPTHAAPAEVTAIDTQARGPLLLLLGGGLVWLVLSGVLALITSIQLHTPTFLADCAWFTHGRAEAMRETAFIYGWAANVGLGIALWVLGRLGGEPLRGLNWTVAGTLFWNAGVALGLVGIATGDMTSFALLELPRYVQPLLVVAYAAIAMSGLLAWWGRRTDGTFASQWYAVAALLLFPWLLIAAQAVLLWMPVRGVVQAVAASWYVQSALTLWLAPLALAGAYYVLPKITGKTLPIYESAPLGFWTLIFIGPWTAGRHLIGGPVPAWVSTMAVVAYSLLLFHYMVVALNFRGALGAAGTAAKFIRFGVIAYVLVGALEFIFSFRVLGVTTQFTFLSTALEQLGLYGGLSMMFIGVMYYMVPRLTGTAWISPGLTTAHSFLAGIGVLAVVATLAAAGWTQATDLANAKVAFADIAQHTRGALLAHTAAQAVLLSANLLLVVNFLFTSASVCCAEKSAAYGSGSSSAKGAHAS